jgi:hypothetical protein
MNNQKYKPPIISKITPAATGIRHRRLATDFGVFFTTLGFNACPQLAQKAALLGLADPQDPHVFAIFILPTHVLGISAGKAVEKGRKKSGLELA